MVQFQCYLNYDGPVYLRFGRPKWPVFTALDDEFVIGKAQMMIEGTDITIIACGHMVWNAIEAAKELALQGISAEIINMHTIKPLDINAVINSARKTNCVLTAEEHQINGGLGDAVAQTLSLNYPTYMDMVGVNDVFGESGTPEELLVKYGLDSKNIISKAKRLISLKNT